MEYKHFLITRLNVFYKKKMPQYGYDPEEWLIGRIKIFKDYCFPSVANQSTKNFQWIFYIDSETPEEIRIDLESLFNPYPNFHLISHKFLDFAIFRFLEEDIFNIAERNFDYLITTRLDTDDMLHIKFLQEIQSQFKGSDYLPINFNNGYVYDIFSGVTAKVSHKFNPFMSLISKVEDGIPVKTIFHRMHHEFQNDPQVNKINTQVPMWCMTINEYNYSTGFFGKVLLKRDERFAVFFSIKEVINPSFLSVISARVNYYLRVFKKIKSRLYRVVYK
ncbi:glycosyltransferase [Algoriphagus terrigena]|uniref:glycosyltransferase n=1 Tax=Algoriphagus terrigena TaxID=344884 RepID=UPI0004218C1D|nr:glycosyltransferase [Algoriphagus terrigena]